MLPRINGGVSRWLAALVAVALCLFRAAPATATERPNVVIFLADDAGWGDYSIHGNQQVATPHIDSLARDGVLLERFFVCPVCAPTRAELLTGRYHPRTGVYGVSTGQERMDLDERTLAEALQAAGYVTGAFGKWHNGSQGPYHPNARGFDEFFGYTSGHWGEYFDPPLEHNGQPVRTRGYIVDVCTERAVDFIERHRDRPFFCYVPFTTPHSPWAVPREYWQRFEQKAITQRGTLPEKENLDETRCALAMLENQDDNVGRVLRKLDELQLSQNTIIIYFSDNGPNTWRWNDGMKGIKGTTDEGGVRSVCLLRYPGRFPAGTRVSQIAGAIDLLPTVLALTGTDRVGSLLLDGRDLSPLLFGNAGDWPDRMLFSTWAGRVSVRTQQHRLDHEGQLYDLQADPGQQRPIGREQPELARRLQAASERWRQDVFGPHPDTAAKPGGQVDPRPFPVGYAKLPRTWLPARDGQPQGNVQRSARAPNSSYFVNWISPTDAIVWDVEVLTAGDYMIELEYTCPADDIGSTIELSFQQSRLQGQVSTPWDPPLYENQDTLPRPPIESSMKEFRTLKLGTMRLEVGQGALTLRALKIPGQQVMHLRSVTLSLQPNDRRGE